MERAMNKLLLATLALPLASLAQETSRYECKTGDLTRRVEIVYETGVTVPCEVHYYKDSESPGDGQVLWRALNEAGYCEARTSEFVSKLEGMGWDCGTAAAVAPADDAVESDDTGDLAPANDIELTEEEVPNS
jgi:hypothetical protein